MFRKELDQGEAGDNVGVLLRGTKKEEVERGMVLCKPSSITPHKNLRVKSMFSLKMRAEGIHHSLMVIDHNFM